MASVVFRPFVPGDEAAFSDLNQAWIEPLFGMEPKDYEVLSDPNKNILQKGGYIFIGVSATSLGRLTVEDENRGALPEQVCPDGGTGRPRGYPAGRPNQGTGGSACPAFAYDAIFGREDGGQAVACFALIPREPGCFELSKMAVHEARRNEGIGRKLIAHAIEQARALGAHRLYLETNRKLANALHLYESAGFTHVPPERAEKSPYARSDIRMEMPL
jgi:GNAT superfamily N-acetyltransferase